MKKAFKKMRETLIMIIEFEAKKKKMCKIVLICVLTKSIYIPGFVATITILLHL